MNPRLDTLTPYPFTRLRALLAQAGTPPADLAAINLSIGEPKHAAPGVVREAIINALDGLSAYPATKGDAALRETIAQWLAQRFSIPAPDAETQVLPALGSREALFAFAQTVLDPTESEALVLCPNPYYQIYDGAARLAGATPWFVNADPARGFACDWGSVPESVWARVKLVFACSPANPTGHVMGLDEWQMLFERAERHHFVIASDECYSDIYPDETNRPLGGLQAARRLGRDDYRNLVSFFSLSKRSNVPGLRSGFVAGEARLLERFLLYRTYHGSAMSPLVTAASIAAWRDEAHVVENRRLYREKFDAVLPILQPALNAVRPQASFYLWLPTPGSDTAFARDVYARTHVTVLPGSFLSREVGAEQPGVNPGINPGAGRVRMALVAPLGECVDAARRIADFVNAH